MISARPPLRLDAVEQAGDGRPDVGLPLAHGPRGETAGHEVAAGPVERVVEADHRRVGRDVRTVPALVLVRVDEQIRVLLDVLDVVVARDAPQLVGGVPVDRPVLAEPRVVEYGSSA